MKLNICLNQLTWYQATAMCYGAGMKLVSIESYKEDIKLVALMKSLSSSKDQGDNRIFSSQLFDEHCFVLYRCAKFVITFFRNRRIMDFGSEGRRRKLLLVFYQPDDEILELGQRSSHYIQLWRLRGQINNFAERRCLAECAKVRKYVLYLREMKSLLLKLFEDTFSLIILWILIILEK